MTLTASADSRGSVGYTIVPATNVANVPWTVSNISRLPEYGYSYLPGPYQPGGSMSPNWGIYEVFVVAPDDIKPWSVLVIAKDEMSARMKALIDYDYDIDDVDVLDVVVRHVGPVRPRKRHDCHHCKSDHVHCHCKEATE